MFVAVAPQPILHPLPFPLRVGSPDNQSIEIFPALAGANEQHDLLNQVSMFINSGSEIPQESILLFTRHNNFAQRRISAKRARNTFWLRRIISCFWHRAGLRQWFSG
jgi:hypothetical protein